MKPYPRYKPTGLAWLPSVPEHWEVVRGKQLFRPIDERSKTGSEQLLSVSERHGVVRRENANVTMFMAQSYDGYKLCWPDDLAINSLWAWSYGLGFSHDFGIISTAYSVFRLKDKEQAIPQFYDYFLRSSAFHWEMRVRSKGLWKSRYQLSDADFLSAPMILPPPSEQDRIVRYLDEKTAAIDELVRAKDREIDLLRERKQALVSAAVTGGLDPATERKDSGVPWIGKIPKGWKVCRLKDIVRSNLESLGESTAPDKQIEYLDISAVGNGYLREKPVRMVFGEAPSRARRIVHEGDTIISTVRTYLKSVLYIDQSVSDCIVSTGFSVLTPKKEIEPRYLGFLLSSNWFVDSVIAQSIGISYPAINDSSLLALSVVFPPLPEQRRIVAHLDSVCSELDAAEAAIRKQIALLQELRIRLVSDAVTGAVEVG